ncbi:MAG: hypothetical protein ACLQVN_18120 [Bryobacteraceae bacterium]
MAGLCLAAGAWAATLEQLSLADLITKSTAIVRGTVQASSVSVSGPVIYTHYTIQVSEQLKRSAGIAATVEVVLPGGQANGVVQRFAGVPQFQAGDEYVFFLWTGASGRTQLTGLTQGLFAVGTPGAANPVVTRAASQEAMLDGRTHRPVRSPALSMTLAQLRSRIASVLSGANP